MNMDNTEEDNPENAPTNNQTSLQQRRQKSQRNASPKQNSNMTFDGSTYYQNKINANPALQSLLLDLVTLKNEYDQIDYGSVDEEVDRMRAAHDLGPLNHLKRRFDDDTDTSGGTNSPSSDDSNQLILLDIPVITLEEIRRQQAMYENTRSTSASTSKDSIQCGKSEAKKHSCSHCCRSKSELEAHVEHLNEAIHCRRKKRLKRGTKSSVKIVEIEDDDG